MEPCAAIRSGLAPDLPAGKAYRLPAPQSSCLALAAPGLTNPRFAAGLAPGGSRWFLTQPLPDRMAEPFCSLVTEAMAAAPRSARKGRRRPPGPGDASTIIGHLAHYRVEKNAYFAELVMDDWQLCVIIFEC
jgi:hypothetical protein